MAGRAPDGKRLAAAIAVAAVVGAVAALLSRPQPLALESGTALPEPRPLPECELVDAGGRTFGRERLEGRWSLVFTGFTHCPDVCPATLALLARLRQRVPGDGLQFLFVSVDPARDTPEVVARYVAHFGPGIEGATGTPEAIERFTAALGLAQVKNPGVGDEYTVDHSTAFVLIDPEARVAGYFQAPHDLEALARDLAPLAGPKARS